MPTTDTLYLVGCGKSKRADPTAAGDLYTDPLVQKSLTYAQQEAAASGGTVRILSALHGAVELDHVLDPYDLSMNDLAAAERRAWGDRVADTLAADVEHERARLVVLAGRMYADPLRRHFPRIGEPMRGLGLGRRLRWLIDHTDPPTPC